MEGRNEIGVVGLGVMGGHLALNLASRGHRVAGYNRSLGTARRLQAEHPEAQLDIHETLGAFVASLRRPRKILVMVPAGVSVDEALGLLDPMLEEGDVVVDGGNSLYSDTDRRIAVNLSRPWDLVGMGVSGGSDGALHGPALMPGGRRKAYEHLRPVLESIAARSAGGPCVAYCGEGSAGHFVKMVHNGIEYGDMQLIAEAVMLLRAGLGLELTQVADVLEEWGRGDLEGYLIGITADILRTPDSELPGAPLVDAVLDQAGQKGTGKWTVLAAGEMGVPIPTLAAAVEARIMSAQRPRRLRASSLFPEPSSRLEGIVPGDVEAALYGAKLAGYAQGFDLLRMASALQGYGIDLREVARIWTAGCIIRARLLEGIQDAYRRESALDLLVFAPEFQRKLLDCLPAWRRVVGAAAAAGWPVSGLAASLTWFEGLRAARGSGYLIQAQRDCFGSHTYERVDRPGVAVHSRWGRGI